MKGMLMTASAVSRSPVAPSTTLTTAAPQMADPMPVAYALFAFALAVYGIRFVGVTASTLAAGSTTVALNYAVLVGGIAEALAGVLGIIRGIGYAGYVTTTFGLWLVGFYLLVTSGAENKAFTPDALAWYVLVLLVPIAILAVPAVVHRNYPFAVAFVAIFALLLLLGLGYHEVYRQMSDAAKSKTAPNLAAAVNLLKTSAWFAFISAAAIWWVFAKEVFTVAGLRKRS
jgi:succinate-acetate transporter protein